MERRKLTKEDIDKVRNIEGFPIAKDEDIIALSDAPYYTACPNPFIAEFIKENGKQYDEATDDYHREPFAADVSEGKNDPIYNAHSYHTKVPHKAIMRYILHYTDPGDIIFDGFCGTGMTGVAAQMCGINNYSLEMQIKNEISYEKWGTRYAIVSDLSPAATFIAGNYNLPAETDEFSIKIERLIAECEKECAWMYETNHTEENSLQLGQLKGKINYVVWSDVFICPQCGKEFVFYDEAVDKVNGEIKDTFLCPHCSAVLRKRECNHSQDVYYDDLLGETKNISKQVPVLINYSVGKKRYDKKPDTNDLALIEKINSMEIPVWVPIEMLPEGEKTSDPKRLGIEYVHQFYTRRNLIVYGLFYEKARKNLSLLFAISALQMHVNKMRRYQPIKPGGTPGLPGTLFLSSISVELSIFNGLPRKVRDISKALYKAQNSCLVSTQSATDLSNIPNNSMDYIFTDPPFGSNLNYSELNSISESWLRVKTNCISEAIMSNVQHKGLLEYQNLMERSFKEFYRILKPNRWMTVEFHNSQNAVWRSIQEALSKAGFVVADVRILDKKQYNFNQVKGANQAIKQDLVISAYKPKSSFVKDFVQSAARKDLVWGFISQHLEKLPVVVINNRRIEINTERQAFMLYDRMLAYHVINNLPVPFDATEFYRCLDEKYLVRDGMYFLPDQVNQYDTARIVNDIEPIQFSLIVSNEKTAISWLYQQLNSPQTYAEIQPKFMQEVKTVDKFEAMPELSVLLEENFLQDDNGKWYIPDVAKEADVAKLREKKLLKEFEGYLATKGKLKLFRTEAIRVGFAKLWKDRNYKLIVDTAERLPEQIVQEDDKLLMYYDISLGRV